MADPCALVVCRTGGSTSEDKSTSSTISDQAPPSTQPTDTLLTLVQTSDDDTWPTPPSPISEACTTVTPVSCDAVLPGSTSPVVKLTFTVKLDSQLLKRRRRQLNVDDLDDDKTPSASPPDTRPPSSSKPRSEMAVVIPDVVVCADAVDAKKDGGGVGSSESDARVTASQTQRGCTASRSCQTEPAAPAQTCTCSYSKADVEEDRDVDDDQLSCRCSSLLDDLTAAPDDDDGMWAQPDVGRAAVRVDDGSYLRPLVTRVYPVDTGDVVSRSGDVELTHMSWSEVLKEAQSMGIPLNLPTPGRQRQASCSTSSTVTSASATPVRRAPETDDRRPRTTTKPLSDSKKTPSSSSSSVIKTSFRDLFRLPQLFSRKKSSSSSCEADNNKRVRRSKSMEPAQRVQTRSLPTPPNNRLHQRHHQRDYSTGSEAERTRHWVSRSSHYSCPPVSSTMTSGSTRCRRSTSGGLSTSRHAVDYYPGSSWAASSCSGSLPAYRHRCTPSSVPDEMTVGVEDLVCASPSVNSFSSVSSVARSMPWKSHRGPPTTPNSLTSSSLASPGQSASHILLSFKHT